MPSRDTLVSFPLRETFAALARLCPGATITIGHDFFSSEPLRLSIAQVGAAVEAHIHRQAARIDSLERQLALRRR